MNELKKQFADLDLIKVFEIEVVDLRTGEDGHIIFDISIDGDQFRAEHESLSLEQEQSKMIAFVAVDLDSDFSLDENLCELSDACNMAIIDSEYFALR